MIDLHKAIHPLIDLAINEDLNTGDITSNAIFNKDNTTRALLLSKDTGVFCGSEIIKVLYSYFNENISISQFIRDGDTILPGDKIAEIKGNTISVLSGERILLNFIQRLSGIASKTRKIVSLIQNTNIKILDTRKTLPGYRILDKFAVKTGGGTNHRMGLFDMIMIKDNHIKAAGSITNAVNKCKNIYGSSFTIEVETTNLTEVEEAITSKADIIMLDNMNKDTMKKAITIINKKAKIEVSGNMDEEKINHIKDLEIDFISIGALTHSVKAFDISMKFE